jgi:murein DD-endopeptidase MepM/ murein hydrolase activator NlpD
VDTTGPEIVSFAVDPYRNVCSAYLTFHWFTTDTSGAGLGQAEIWRTNDPPDSEDREWEQVAINQAPLWTFWWTDSIQVFRPSGGLWWYGLHVTDLAGNCTLEPDPPGPLTIVMPFLEPPVHGSTPAVALTGNTGTSCGSVGRVNCWFDHKIPTKEYERDDNYIYLWTGEPLPSIYDNCTLGENCYDGHDAIDFCGPIGEDIYAASSGTVWSVGTQHVVIEHPNFFFTLYMHITPTNALKNGTVTEVTRNTKLGETNAEDHVHFALYYDRDGSGSYSHDEIVDPFGWRPTTTGIIDPNEEEDPWAEDDGFQSYYFWYETGPIYSYMSSLGNAARITQSLSFFYAKGLNVELIVERDGLIITANGPKASAEFAEEIAKALGE